MMDFSGAAGKSTGNGENIPNGQLAWAFITVRGVKPSNSGGQYIDVELTLDDGQPYARRKVWEMIGDPNHPGNSDKYREMGQVAICRILEAGRGAGPHNMAAYQLQSYEQLSGLRVPIKIKIEKGKDGYDDKNKVAEWLTPNPQSSGHKDFQKLTSGVFNTSAQAGGGFGGQPPQQPPQSTFAGFGNQGGAPMVQTNSGWGQSGSGNNSNGTTVPVEGGQMSGFSNPPAANNGGWGTAGAASPSPLNATQVGDQSAGNAPMSPSNDPAHGNQPAWLAQANGG